MEEIQELNTNVTEQKLLEDNHDAEELEIRNTPNIDKINVGRLEQLSTKQTVEKKKENMKRSNSKIREQRKQQRFEQEEIRKQRQFEEEQRREEIKLQVYRR